jgi:transmembrane sensor
LYLYYQTIAKLDQTTIRLEELLNKSSLSEEEISWLLEYLKQSDTPELRLALLEKFAGDLSLNNHPELLQPAVSEKMLRAIMAKTGSGETPAVVKRMSWGRIAAAVCLLGLALVSYFIFSKNSSPKIPVITTRAPRTDVAPPAGSRATITLGNGTKIILDSTNSGTLATQGEVLIEKTKEGEIAYRGTAVQSVYNTLFNPRGSKPVSLTLSDGSKVWLNSESTLRYPTSFTGTERTVEISGEAYFEVKKNLLSPFRVSIAGRGTVEVLGTHFNINSYADELNTRITLLEGSVRIGITAAYRNMVVIQPGQQALYPNVSPVPAAISVKNNVDLAAVMAWKNGYFNFDNSDLYAVMRQLSRWYDIQVQYEGKIGTRKFGGDMQRDLNLSEVLKLLEKNNVHFKIENNFLIVRP